ncbi:helicase HerA-like domain-containing protein [Mycobacteroides franklinii]|uniref:AAA-like domain protein n=1 Tax=Mycobacteroides franklinii TaxID=948102 RepID=A0A4R8RGT5_9MYCO|nr:helicase HerA-like domain-containing protein [Mycobacteroides franklinii]TDZ42169.1 AAA-like domain protein [Mycobacteroides franklinii]TDZ52317.1 AAA-like domain protein [Mycobacteroides franklinii]TDZ55724.1 AAA-like domain protein [Mycobacteroides franklinii]TDZ62665.1 AAA-like domain protein [Mycobacteroides franklinii]TDZ69062.1 AAA-like domain protein [Mycobacteroides franklinii]
MAEPTTAGTTPAQQIAAGYATTGQALELGSVIVDGTVDPAARIRIPLATLNRHGLIAGATGTGKTKTLQVIAEQLSAAGVPVVMADVKGDLSGISKPGEANDKTAARAKDTGDDWAPSGFPAEFMSLGTTGIGVPIRATIHSFGPILLSKVLGLNATQESTLGLIFHWADQQGLALLDLKDLRAVITYLASDEGKADLKSIGGVSAATAGVILRALVNLEADGGDTFFGEPEIQPTDLMRIADGRGIITLLELGTQAARPALFSTFLMWILADLFTVLPEVGDVDKPKLVFIFDEAHLLFTDASKAFLEQVEQTVKLIRSKGVGVFFCTQLPTDIPNDVLSQLGARIQHALRAFTPDDQKALTKTVRTYPKTGVYDLEKALTSLGIGEAIVTVLSEVGAPTPVAWTRLRAPRSLMGAIGDDAIKAAAAASPLQSKYGQTVDSRSAYEILRERAAQQAPADQTPTDQAPAKKGATPAPEKPRWWQRLLSNRSFQSFLSALGKQLIRNMGKK